MTPAIYALAALLVGAASLFAASAWLRAGSYVCLVAAMFGLWRVSLGLPRPALFGVPKGTVVAFTLDEPRAIYVWLQVQGSERPVSIQLPWHESEAAALHQAAQQAKAMGAKLKMRGQRGSGNDIPGLHQLKPMFYPASPEPLPPKVSP